MSKAKINNDIWIKLSLNELEQINMSWVPVYMAYQILLISKWTQFKV